MRVITALLVAAGLAALAAPADAQVTARAMYSTLQGREQAARRALDAGKPERIARRDVRSVIAGYEGMVGRFPRSGYSDNALWQAGMLAADSYARYRVEADRLAAIRLLRRLGKEYPTSSLVKKARPALTRLAAAAPAAQPKQAAPPTVTASAPAPAPSEPAPVTASTPAPAAASVGPVARITAIRRTVLPEIVRIAIEVDREVDYQYDRIGGPVRVFLDLAATEAAPDLPSTLPFEDSVVRGVRLGPRPDRGTRVVLDLEGGGRHSVFNLYNPYRIVVDIERGDDDAPVVAAVNTSPGRPAVLKASSAPAAAATPPPAVPPVEAPLERVTVPTEEPLKPAPPVPLPSRAAVPAASAAPAAPKAPSANVAGRFSLSRQLGLGINRIVIDPGHGGHDPGATSRGLSEAELVLDVARRLEALLLKEPGIEVVLTRRSDVFIPLEERTAIANREGADLFLSIHANASRRTAAYGIETYFLNFASNPEAEAVAARENSASGQSMHSLPDIVKAIALNNKLDESRDFATLVQRAMVEHLRKSNGSVRDLGVKQAPFVVLIGAGMPSVLAEISFVTNPQEGRLLKTGAYRQRIAEALLHGIRRYQRSLKAVTAVASQE